MEDERNLAHRRWTAAHLHGFGWKCAADLRHTAAEHRWTPKRNHGSDWVDNYFVDNSVFERPSDFTLGNAPRALGSVRSTWSFTTDLSLGKQFSIREETNLEFRIEARNAFNHPVFGTQITSVDDDNFGKIFSTAVGPREVQLALKFNF